MFEKEIKFIADFSLNKIKNLGSFFTFEKLLSTDIHPSIIQYISAELDYLIYEDRRKLLQQSVFDYSGKEIAKYFELINKEIKRTKRISFEDIKKLVIQAVSFNVNYVSRPRWSLTKLVYDNADNKAIDEIMLMLNYLHYYDYLKNILISYLNKRKIVNLSLIEFELILNKIDKEVFVPAQTQTLLDDAFNSLGDLFNIGGVSKSKISPVAVEVFLKEKNLIDYLFRLRRALPQNAKSSYEIEEIRKVIYSTVPIEQQHILTPDDKIAEDISPEDYKPIQPKSPDLNTGKSIAKHVEVSRPKPIPEPEPENEPGPDEELDIENDIAYPKIDELDEVPADSELNDDELLVDGTQDIENLLKMFDEELKEFEKETEKITTDNDELKFDISHKDQLDELYEFEEPADADFKKTADEIFLDEAVNEELSESDDYELLDEKIDDAVSETFDKLDITDKFIDEESEAKNDSEKKRNFESGKVDTGDKQKQKNKNFTKDIFNYLANKEIDKIISNVFNDDGDDFTNTIERITECSSYEEATEILKGVFFSYRVNPYSRDAVALTNAVSNYFNQV